MRSDNLQLPCVQPPTSSWLRYGHGDNGDRGKHGGRGGQDRTGRVGTGRDGTGRDKLTFKLNYPGNL